MSDFDIEKNAAETANLSFDVQPRDRTHELWRFFDKDLAKELPLFIIGRMYAREKIPHPTQQLVAVAALTALEKKDELKLHIWAGLQMGCAPEELEEAIFQTGVYAGIPAMNQALSVFKQVLVERGDWPPDYSER